MTFIQIYFLGLFLGFLGTLLGFTAFKDDFDEVTLKGLLIWGLFVFTPLLNIVVPVIFIFTGVGEWFKNGRDVTLWRRKK